MVLVREITGSQRDFFLEGDVRSLMQAGHKLPKPPSPRQLHYIVVVTKEPSSSPRHAKGSRSLVWVYEDVKSGYFIRNVY